MTLNLTNLDPVMKQLYKPSLLNDLTFKKRPFFGMVKKSTDFGGRNMPIPIQYANSQGRSATFSDAQANITGNGYEDFLLEAVENNAVARITDKALRLTSRDPHSFVRGLKAKIDGAVNSLADSIETQLFRDGWGAIGTVSAATSTTFTMTNREEIANIEVGMSLTAADAATGATARTGTMVVSKVNRVTGVATYTGGLPTGFVAGDYLFVEGDTDGGTNKLCISGFAAWCPNTAPSASEDFFGVDRSVDTRLSGQIYATAGNHDDQLIEAAGLVEEAGGSADLAFIHHVDMRTLNKLLQGETQTTYYKATSSSQKPIANIGYAAYKIHTNGGVMDVMAANKQQSGIASVMDFSSWQLYCANEPIHLKDRDGNQMLRLSTSNDLESRWGFLGNLATNAPAYNCHLTFA